MSEDKFLELELDGSKIKDIEPTSKANSIIVTLVDDNKIIFSKRAFSQLLKQMGMKVVPTRKWMRDDPEEVINLIKTWLRNRTIYLGIAKGSDGILYCYRVTTEKFTPIPHKVLFEFIDNLFREKKVRVYKKPMKFLGRYGVFYQLYYNKLRRGDNLEEPIKIGILITNANTATKAIHITPLVFFGKSPYPTGVEKMIRIVHRAKLETILEKVGEALLDTLRWLKLNYPVLMKRIEKLLEIKVDRYYIEEFLDRLFIELPKKYHGWLQKILDDNLAKYGETLYAIYKTLAYFVGVTYKTPSIQEKFLRKFRSVEEVSC